jgi:murein L,D-transpeptidase YcbB/YkuD
MRFVHPTSYLRAGVVMGLLLAAGAGEAAALRPPPPVAPTPPSTAGETALEEALRAVEAIAASGGYTAIHASATLRPGERGPAVAELAQRLGESGDLAAAPADPALFDAALEAAVRRFQERSGLEADGLVGRRTLARLNEPAEDLAERIRANIERARAEQAPIFGRAIVVNIPAFTLTAYRDGRPVLAMPVVVGRPQRETPMLGAQITHMVVNPDWTVPPVILRQDVARHMLDRDVDYLASHGFQIIATESIRPLAFDSADWNAVAAGRSNPRLVQPPGPANPLGRIKFMMPNPHAVYLHDTNEPQRFESAERAFSSGCVRVADALALAAFVAEGANPVWRDWATDPTWRTRWLRLPAPIQIRFVYRTVWVDERGVLQVRADLYGLDGGLEARQLAAAGSVAAN